METFLLLQKQVGFWLCCYSDLNMTDTSSENCQPCTASSSWKWKGRKKERKNVTPFCYAILAKIKWQIVIKLEENKLVMFVLSQAQLSFHLDNESFTHSQSSLYFLWHVGFNQQIDIVYRKLPIIRAVLSWGKVCQHARALEICGFVGFCW